MSFDQMSDLTIRPLADGGLELEQGGALGEPAVIHLHPSQITLIAERAGIANDAQARCLKRLADWFRYLDDFYGEDITERCGLEEGLCLKAIRECVDELIPRERPESDERPQTKQSSEGQLPLLEATK